jgi:NADH-quinone oxidoreductase subunit L
MFRLVFLAFHGERRGGGPEETGHRDARGHASRGLHDAPPAMAIALIVLAVGSLAAGYIGVPAALGGSNQLEHFLEPSFTAGAAAAHGEAHPSLALEFGLMGASTLAAFAGIAIAAFYFLRRPDAATTMAERFSGAHRLLLHQYYVDELYDAAVVQPIRRLSDRGLWRGVDIRVIDGAVNGVGAALLGTGGLLRRLQSGSVRAYAAYLVLGAVLVVGYYLW